MALQNYLFTSESVTEGHPDKLCDNVSDAILDAHLAADPGARVACETSVKTGFVLLAGEITSTGLLPHGLERPVARRRQAVAPHPRRHFRAHRLLEDLGRKGGPFTLYSWP